MCQGGGSVLDSDWHKLKQAVLDKLTPEGVSWAAICAIGNQNLVGMIGAGNARLIVSAS